MAIRQCANPKILEFLPGLERFSRMRANEDGGMDFSILQDPADPDATYREKAGKQNRGYVANVTESVGEAGGIIADDQYEQNTYSDSQFMRDTNLTGRAADDIMADFEFNEDGSKVVKCPNGLSCRQIDENRHALQQYIQLSSSSRR